MSENKLFCREMEKMGESVVGKKALFLDRDGVLNEALVRNGKPYPPSNRAELRIIPAAFSVLQKLKLGASDFQRLKMYLFIQRHFNIPSCQ